MPTITIHRGTRTIGGSSVEILSGQHRILIDLGSPLMQSGGGEIDPERLENPSVANKILPDIQGLYKDDIPGFDAVFISHSHMDHCGLLNHIHRDIPVYLSAGSLELMRIGQVFYPRSSRVYLDTFRVFEHWQPMKVGPFCVTSYLMDHSGYDASAFLVESENKKIFYTGDFRGHGRKERLLKRLIEHPIQGMNCLLMEGTTLGGQHQAGFANETEVEKGFCHIFKAQEDASFVAAAGSNVDRLVSLYKACRSAGKTLVLDLYTFYLLDRLKEITPGLPPFKGDHIRIFYIKGHAQRIADHLGQDVLYRYRSRKIELDEIATGRCDMVIKLPVHAMTRIARRMIESAPLTRVKLIYAMWQGYLEKETAYSDFCSEFNAELVHIHVSGHAWLDDLKKLAIALNPETLVPIHTLNAKRFNTLFSNVFQAQDGVPFDI
ncbi:MAG: MBL fold metallo-hydrolase [Desulfobacteraceae bacterium]|nr:MAG: MBL fold metallo-hydrolase [Desulfobacteraceae bacterium]